MRLFNTRVLDALTRTTLYDHALRFIALLRNHDTSVDGLAWPTIWFLYDYYPGHWGDQHTESQCHVIRWTAKLAESVRDLRYRTVLLDGRSAVVAYFRFDTCYVLSEADIRTFLLSSGDWLFTEGVLGLEACDSTASGSLITLKEILRGDNKSPRVLNLELVFGVLSESEPEELGLC